MKRTFATLGVVGLGLISLTAPAMAANERVVVCHNDGGSWAPLEFNVHGLGGHEQHPLDIIPPTSQSAGKNWTDAGKLLYVEKCAALPPGETLPVVEQPPVVVVPPVVNPPAENPPAEQPPAVTPVVDPPAVTPDPVAEVPAVVVDPPAAPVVEPVTVAPVTGAVAAPQTPAAAQPAARTGAPAATTSLGTNQGYNAQTAVGGAGSSPAWLGGLGALVAAGAAVAVRRRSGATAG